MPAHGCCETEWSTSVPTSCTESWSHFLGSIDENRGLRKGVVECRGRMRRSARPEHSSSVAPSCRYCFVSFGALGSQKDIHRHLTMKSCAAANQPRRSGLNVCQAQIHTGCGRRLNAWPAQLELTPLRLRLVDRRPGQRRHERRRRSTSLRRRRTWSTGRAKRLLPATRVRTPSQRRLRLLRRKRGEWLADRHVERGALVRSDGERQGGNSSSTTVQYTATAPLPPGGGPVQGHFRGSAQNVSVPERLEL